MEGAKRMDNFSEYYFSKKLKEIQALGESGKSIINLGIGNPDLMPPPEASRHFNESIGNRTAHGYQPYNGIKPLRDAIASFSRKYYQVELDSEDEILPLMGSKEGITHISLAFLNPGDEVLIPELGYPTYTSVTKMVGANPVVYPFKSGAEPDWDFLESLDYTKVKLMWVNYPHMPTGASGSSEFFQRLINLARDKGHLLVNDNPYSFILNDEPRSVFSLEGSKDVCLELNSLSKSFNMAGWRVGWVSGNKDHLKHILAIKSNMDSGMFYPIQKAAAEVLSLGNSWFDDLNSVYRSRKNVARQLLSVLGCGDDESQSGMFVWSKLKEGDSEKFVDHVLKTHHIFLTPGHIFGEKGRDHIRISLCNPVEVFEKAIARIAP